ncbi:MAG: hypothetical protein ABI462_14130, partial [Ignavibacteria bacterium]
MKYFFLFLTYLLSFVCKGQVSATLTVPKGHKGIVRNCYFTPDDKYLVSTDYDHVLCIWDGDDGRQIFTLRDSLGSFGKIEMDNATTVIAALSDSGQLYIINFRQLRVIAKVDNVSDFSINKSTGSVFIIIHNQFNSSINKYNPKTFSLQKIKTKNLQRITKVIALSETSIALQDDMEGVLIANTLTGKLQPVADRLSIYLTLYDYHPYGRLLCAWKNSADFSLYNIDIKSNTVKDKVSFSNRVEGFDCAYTANPENILISKMETADDFGSIEIKPPFTYSLKTKKEIKELGSDPILRFSETSLNSSHKSIVAITASGDYEHNAYLRYDFLSNSVSSVYNWKRVEESDIAFACANNSKKIAVFSKDLLLPAIYPTGIVSNNSPAGIKNYGHLTIDIPKNADKTRNNRFDFLFSNEFLINDSVRLAITDTSDTNTNFYTGIVYRRNNNATTDSFHFAYYNLIKPLFNADKLFWSADSVFYVLNLSDLKIADSVRIPGIRVPSLTKLGNTIEIDGYSGNQDQGYRYDIIQKKLTKPEFSTGSHFFRPYQENTYVRSMNGYQFSDAEISDYDYLNDVVSTYPFSAGRIDTVATFDTTGEMATYQAVLSVPYVTFSSLDTNNTRSRSLYDEIEGHAVLQVRYWDNGCYIIMTKQNKLFVYSFAKDTVLKKIECPTNWNASPYNSSLFVQEQNKYLIVSDKDRNECFIVDVVAGKIAFHLKGFYNPQIRQPAELLVLEDAAFGNYFVYNNKSYNYVSSITPFSKTDYVITTNSGLFDGTEKAIENLYLLINDKEDKVKPWKTIDLTQLKAKYYIPGLWDKLISGDSTDLPDVESIKNISLAPEIITDTVYSFTKPYKVTLLDKG